MRTHGIGYPVPGFPRRVPAKCLVAGVVLFAAVGFAGCGGGASVQSSSSGSTPSFTYLRLNAGPAPWPEPDQVQARVSAAGLFGAPTESLTVHYHAHLDIFVNGHPEPVAASIGRQDDSFFSPLHTHANSGMIHIEAGRDQKFTLGMLFTEWGVRLTRSCIGGYCQPATRISTYIDGRRTGEPLPNIVFTKGEEIALVIGSPPASIPSHWDCRAKINPAIENPAQCADFGQ
jgi:hypothetical protein